MLQHIEETWIEVSANKLLAGKRRQNQKIVIEQTVLFTHISNKLNAESIVRFSKRIQNKPSEIGLKSVIFVSCVVLFLVKVFCTPSLLSIVA